MGSKNTFMFVREGRLNFYCPLCHSQQATNVAEKITWKHHAQLALLTAVVTFASWPLFGINSVLFYLIFWGTLEFVHRFKKRDQLVCNTCGFDPFLYKQDTQKARDAVKKFWEAKIENENLFHGVKLKNYQTKIPQKEEKAAPDASIP